MTGPPPPVPDAKPTGPTADGRTRARPLVWISAALSALVVSANLSVMGVAFDALRHSFPGTQLSVLGWVLSVYTIVFGAFLVPAGRIADHLGRRRVFLWGLWIFGVSSLVAGLAPAVWVIILGRVGQGIGAACLVPSTLGLLLDAVAPHRRATATAFYSAIASLGGMTGPTIGGVLIHHGGWRWAFFIAPVIAALSWATGRSSLPPSSSRADGPLPDHLGAFLLIAGLAAISLAIMESPAWGVTDARIVAALAVAAVCVVVFLRRSSRHPVPILPLHLARERSFSVANVASMLYGIATGSLLFATVMFVREAWGYSEIQAGAALIPLAAASAVVSTVVGRLGGRFGERAVGVPGALTVAVGLAWCALRLDAGADFLGGWLPGMAVVGLGMGLTYPMIGSACVRDVDSRELSVASASNRTTLQVGNAIGIALVIAVLGAASGAEVADRMRTAWLVTAGLAATVAASLATLGPPRRHPGPAPSGAAGVAPAAAPTAPPLS